MLVEVHKCLNNISNLLKEVILFTYGQEPQSKQKKFFLVGYEHRKGFSKKIFGDPNNCDEGVDLKWQLRNIRWHLAKYAELMNMYEDVLDDLTGFLLDTTFQCYLGSAHLHKMLADPNLLNDCVEVCLEIVGAIEDAGFYQGIHTIASELRQKLEHQELNQTPGSSTKASKDTEETLVKNDFIGAQKSTDKKPISNSIHTQFSKKIDEDSGIFGDVSGISGHVQTSVTSTPVQDNKKSTRQKPTTSPHTPMQTATPGKHQSFSSQRLQQKKLDTSMNSSMVIIDTPTIKNKPIDILKQTSNSSQKKKTPLSSLKKRSSKDDEMDGSFVLI